MDFVALGVYGFSVLGALPTGYMTIRLVAPKQMASLDTIKRLQLSAVTGIGVTCGLAAVSVATSMIIPNVNSVFVFLSGCTIVFVGSTAMFAVMTPLPKGAVNPLPVLASSNAQRSAMEVLPIENESFEFREDHATSVQKQVQEESPESVVSEPTESDENKEWWSPDAKPSLDSTLSEEPEEKKEEPISQEADLLRDLEKLSKKKPLASADVSQKENGLLDLKEPEESEPKEMESKAEEGLNLEKELEEDWHPMRPKEEKRTIQDELEENDQKLGQSEMDLEKLKQELKKKLLEAEKASEGRGQENS